MSAEKLYFFDYQSTSPIDPEVLSVMFHSAKYNFGNAHSTSHKYGWNAVEEIENSRSIIAKIINAHDDEVIFTSGATESNNLAIKGVARFYQNKGKHIITMSTEHKCVLESCEALQLEGFEITYINPLPNGLLDIDSLKAVIRPDTILISVMCVNNETGVIQNIKEIGQVAREKDIIFHTDCAQAFGKMKLDVKDMNVDLMSISAHKIYGPKGIGALYVAKEPKRIRLTPLIHGGGQERGFRSGTLPTFLIAGFGKAAEMAVDNLEEDRARILKFEDQFLNELLPIEDCFLNGDRAHKIHGCINLSILHIEGESLLMSMPDICVSTGSACNSATLEPSYVISAMRNDTYYAHSAIRFGFGRFTTEDEVDYLINSLKKSIQKLRDMSPLWEMKQNGVDLSSIQWDSHH